MGREQGDHLGDEQPVTYFGTVNGREYERTASTPAEHVNLRARGWVTAESLGRTSSTPTTTSTGTSTSEAPSAPSDSSTQSPDDVGNEAPARRGGKRAPDAASAAPQDEAAAAAGERG